MADEPEDVIADIRASCRNAAKKCEDQGCKLDLAGIESFVVERPDRETHKGKMCDCLIFARHKSRLILAIAELKSGTTHVDAITSQLQAGATRAREVLAASAAKYLQWEPYAVALAQKWHGSAVKEMAKKRIELGGQKIRVRAKRCGSKLLDVIGIRMLAGRAKRTVKTAGSARGKVSAATSGRRRK